MKRRALLQVATTGAAGLLAGCLEGEGNPDGSGAVDAGGSRTPTDTTTLDGSGGDATGDGTDAGTDDGETAEPTDDDSTDDETPGDETPDDETPKDEADRGEETPTDSDDGSSSESDPSGSNAIVDHEFEVADAECGQGEQRADVSRAGDRVNVDGTIRGRNGCYTAELEDVTYDEGDDVLTVAVRAYEGGDREYCQQCIVDVDYRASVEFEDGTPATVRVLHDDERVTAA